MKANPTMCSLTSHGDSQVWPWGHCIPDQICIIISLSYFMIWFVCFFFFCSVSQFFPLSVLFKQFLRFHLDLFTAIFSVLLCLAFLSGCSGIYDMICWYYFLTTSGVLNTYFLLGPFTLPNKTIYIIVSSISSLYIEWHNRYYIFLFPPSNMI